MDKPATELVIVLGCGDQKELTARLDLALAVYKGILERKHFGYVFMSGTKTELVLMTTVLESRVGPGWALLGEDRSVDTIDNIINSFKSVFDIKYGAKYYFDDETREPADAFPFCLYHVVSSAYHLKRVKFILDTLEYSGRQEVQYHGSLVYDNRRLVGEYKVDEKLEAYKKAILQRYLRSHERLG